jgi:hypothetical protein
MIRYKVKLLQIGRLELLEQRENAGFDGTAVHGCPSLDKESELKGKINCLKCDLIYTTWCRWLCR